jgi:hypothetical protein
MLKSGYIFIFFLVLSPQVLFSQSELFTYDINGLHPNFVVVELDSLNASELYQKSTRWINETGRTIKSSVASDNIIFEGSKTGALCTTLMGKTSCNDVRYQVDIAFKDKKYKFEVKLLEEYGPVNQTGLKDWFETSLSKAPDHYYTRGGALKKEFVSIPGEMAGLFNDLNAALKTYLESTPKAKKEDGW